MKKFKLGIIAALLLSVGSTAALTTNISFAANDTNTSATDNNGIKTITPVTNEAVQVTVPNAKLYNKAGQLASRGLNQGSAWRVGSELFRNDGLTYFQVSSDEYLPATDGYLYGTYTGIAKIATSTPATLYDHNQKAITGRSLAPNSSWQTDRSITVYSSDDSTAAVHYYRVSTDEWVKSDDVDAMTYLNTSSAY